MVIRTKSNAVTEFMEPLKSDPHMPEWQIRQAHDAIRQSRRPLSYQNPPGWTLAPWRVSVSYTHLRAHETPEHLVCRLLLEKKKKQTPSPEFCIYST